MPAVVGRVEEFHRGVVHGAVLAPDYVEFPVQGACSGARSSEVHVRETGPGVALWVVGLYRLVAESRGLSAYGIQLACDNGEREAGVDYCRVEPLLKDTPEIRTPLY